MSDPVRPAWNRSAIWGAAAARQPDGRAGTSRRAGIMRQAGSGGLAGTSPSPKSVDVLARADRPGSGRREQEAAPNQHPLPSPLSRPLHRRAVRVLHLDPVPRRSGLVGRGKPLRNDAFKSARASLARPVLGNYFGLFPQPSPRRSR
jgi:hypothetical protein